MSQISFIKEGEFSEIKGKPTVKIIGKATFFDNLSRGAGGKKIIKTKGIRFSDIVLAFLNLDYVEEPLEFIKQICFENTAFLPIYYFIYLSKIEKRQIIEIIKQVITRANAKSKLLERLSANKFQILYKPTKDTDLAKKKMMYIDQIKRKKVNPDADEKDIKYILQCIRMLEPVEIRNCSEYVRNILKSWFNKYYCTASASLAGDLRRAICWVDEALYAKDVKSLFQIK